MMRPPFTILTGPTGVGKTALSLSLAQHLNAEIISADSRQVYRNLDIGTAKPDAEALATVPHHFIDERELGQSFSAGQFAEEAAHRIEDILARGRTPLIVGGSTLYLHALQHGLADIPPIDESVRHHLQARLTREGAAALYGELERVDPASAATMDPTKSQRIVRALEVYEGTGTPLSHYHANQSPPRFTFRTFVLHRDRAELYARIESRVDAMLEQGLLEEVESLHSRGYDRDLNPLRTIGYEELFAFLNDEIRFEEAVRLIKRNSRRYAKRQLTWFRRDADATWMQEGELRTFFDLQ